MKLRLISEQTNNDVDEMISLVRTKLPSALSRKLLEFAFRNRQHTNPGDRHTASVAKSELIEYRRLVALVWVEDVDCDISDFYVIKLNDNQLVMSLPENKDMADIIGNGIGSITGHIVRGLAFGYNPESVLKFISNIKYDDPWKEYIKSFGIRLAEDDGGYSSVARTGAVSKRFNCELSGNIIVFQNEVKKVENNLHNFGRLLYIVKMCRQCDSYISVAGDVPHDFYSIDGSNLPNASECPHEAEWYNFEFDLTDIKQKLIQLM